MSRMSAQSARNTLWYFKLLNLCLLYYKLVLCKHTDVLMSVLISVIIWLLDLCSLRSLVMVEIQMVMTMKMMDITKDALWF